MNAHDHMKNKPGSNKKRNLKQLFKIGRLKKQFSVESGSVRLKNTYVELIGIWIFGL